MGIKFDFNNIFTPRISPPYGIDCKDIDSISKQISKAHDNISLMRKENRLAFLDLLYKDNLAHAIHEIKKTKENRFENYVSIAIGGSALGSIAVFNALSNPYHNLLSNAQRNYKPRMFFPDNIDPDRICALLDVLDLDKTLINVISKSGSTVETIANFLILRQKLIEKVGIKSYRDHIIMTTSENQGELSKIAREEGICSLSIPDNLEGRFSVLSPSGLLCATFLDYDIKEFMAGARSMDTRIKEPNVWKNPAYLYSSLHYLADQNKGLNIFVIMPYSHALRTFADWTAQLIAESLGKKSKAGLMVGPTPVKALGVTDQHSQLQLYIQGKMDKVITFIAIENFNYILSIPKAYSNYDSIGYLGGHTLSELFAAEREATELSLTKNNRLNCTIYLPQINPYILGELFCFFELSVIFLGELYNVNPFDQPGVEESKDYARQLMGKKEYGIKGLEIEGLSGKDLKYCL
jgi:glucose-6-phosphate isomerase